MNPTSDYNGLELNEPIIFVDNKQRLEAIKSRYSVYMFSDDKEKIKSFEEWCIKHNKIIVYVHREGEDVFEGSKLVRFEFIYDSESLDEFLLSESRTDLDEIVEDKAPRLLRERQFEEKKIKLLD